MPKNGSIWHPAGPMVSIERTRGKTIGIWIAELKTSAIVGWNLRERVGEVVKMTLEFYPGDLVIRGDQKKPVGQGYDSAQPGDYYEVYDQNGEVIGGAIKPDREPWES